MERHGLDEMNEDEEIFADLCASNRLDIGGRRINKVTWISLDRRSENRVYRGADVASDHHLVLAKIKMKLKRVWLTRSTRPCYNVGLLKDRDVLDRFRLSLNNRYQVN